MGSSPFGGRISNAVVVKDPGSGFGAAALELIKRYRCEPGRKGGVPVSVFIPFRVTFALN